ncbi:MAG: PhnD/SsuA/transferrin family substrate-binding protein [Thiotrichales bacterium]|nr:MAG: PhnD/SsuA/transferrin family substrate-binding protein [Thiotrichales bacterium]
MAIVVTMYFRYFLIIFLLLISSTAARAENYFLSVQPVLPPDQIVQNYQPLVKYLSNKTGHIFTVKSYRNFLTYWARMQKAEDMHFILDAAHFTDYRVKRKDYRVLAKFPDTVSFTVVTGEENFVFEMDELISKKIATMASPGMGAVRLNSMFPNPVRLPFYIEASNAVDAVNKVLEGYVDAAIIPSPLVGNYESLNTVTSTDPVPHMALSASPKVPAEVAQAVKQALLDASKTPAGKKMLEQMNIEYFEDADDKMYAGYADLLEGIFGY